MDIINFVGKGIGHIATTVSVFNPANIHIFVEENQVNKIDLKKEMKQYVLDSLFRFRYFLRTKIKFRHFEFRWKD